MKKNNIEASVQENLVEAVKNFFEKIQEDTTADAKDLAVNIAMEFNVHATMLSQIAENLKELAKEMDGRKKANSTWSTLEDGTLKLFIKTLEPTLGRGVIYGLYGGLVGRTQGTVSNRYSVITMASKKDQGKKKVTAKKREEVYNGKSVCNYQTYSNRASRVG